MILKLTENGGFTVIEVTECRFSRAPTPHVEFKRQVVKDCPAPEKEKLDLLGDAFVLNGRGDTVEKFFIVPRKAGY